MYAFLTVETYCLIPQILVIAEVLEENIYQLLEEDILLYCFLVHRQRIHLNLGLIKIIYYYLQLPVLALLLSSGLLLLLLFLFLVSSIADLSETSVSVTQYLCQSKLYCSFSVKGELSIDKLNQ
jgi:hypothetical protein